MPFLPQVQSQTAVLVSGRFAPQFEQKFPRIPVCPQVQTHPTIFSVRLAPQIEQKLPLIPFCPQVQSHVSVLGVAAFAVSFCSKLKPCIIFPICGEIALAAAIPTPSPIMSPTMLLPPPLEIAGPMFPIPSAYAF
jgi:hypothetical protein